MKLLILVAATAAILLATVIASAIFTHDDRWKNAPGYVFGVGLVVMFLIGMLIR